MKVRSHLLTLTLFSLTLVAEVPTSFDSWAVEAFSLQAVAQSVDTTDINSLRQQSLDALNTSSSQRKQAEALLEAQNYEEAHQVVRDAISSGRQSVALAAKALELGLTFADETLLDTLYSDLSTFYFGIALTYKLQAKIYEAENDLINILTARQNELSIWIEALEVIQSSDNEADIVLHKFLTAQSSRSTSIIHSNLGQYQEAITLAETTLKISQDIVDPGLKLSALLKLSQDYYDLGERASQDEEYDQARQYYNRAQVYTEQMLQLSESPLEQLQSPDALEGFATVKTPEYQQHYQEQALTRLHIILSAIGFTYEKQHNYSAALETTQKLLELSQRMADPERIGANWGTISSLQQQSGNYDAAIQASLQMESIAENTNNLKLLSSAHMDLASYYTDLGRYPEAFTYYESARSMFEEQGDTSRVISVLNNLGLIATNQGEYEKALGFFNEALTTNRIIQTSLTASDALQNLGDYCFLWQELGWDITDRYFRQGAEEIRKLCLDANLDLESKLLNNIGTVYKEQSRYRESIDLHREALDINRRYLDSPASEAIFVNNIGLAYYIQDNYPLALEFFNEALAIHEEIDNYADMIPTLNNIGIVYQDQGEYSLALESQQRALKLARELNLKPSEVNVLGNIGTLYKTKGDYGQSEYYYQQSLQLAQDLKFLPDQALQLLNLGFLAYYQGQYTKALDYLDQSVAIQSDIGKRFHEIASLQLRGDIYLNQGKFAAALAQHETALKIARELNDLDETAYALRSLSQTYVRLGQPEQAVSLYQEALSIFSDINLITQQASIYDALGTVAVNQEEYAQALDSYQQALSINRSVGAVGLESLNLTNIGYAHYYLGDLAAAEEAFTQALTIQQRIGQGADIGRTLNGLALVTAAQDNSAPAIDLFQQALARHRLQGDRSGAAKALGDLGKLYANQDQPALATVFLKQAVNTYESIRKENRILDQDLQSSYTETVADTYRQLADVLLTQGRIPEAQRVLDLLKIEELREFTSQTRATWKDDGIEYSDLEQPVIDTHGDLIAFGQALHECKQTSCDQIEHLLDQQDQLLKEYNHQVNTFNTTVRDNRYKDGNFQDPTNLLDQDARELLATHPNSVLIYPFVTDEKLWLLYASQGSLGSIQIDVSQAELSATVQQFGELLKSGQSLGLLQTTSQQLYDWLITPIETALQDNEIQHLIFVNDRVTRYIPMAALYDGSHYLIENYTVSSILSTRMAYPEAQLGAVSTSQVLGLGVAKPLAGFNPLPAVEQELDSIIRTDNNDSKGIYPGQIHLDEDFTLEQLKSNVYSHRVLHIATHAEFVPGNAGDSYIMLGDGERLTGLEIDNMGDRLENLHMVVLSACQTALGGEAGDGTEIAGMSAYFLEAGRAESVLASLWAVDDESTSLLMQRFYEFLATGELTKAEALQQAQLSLLYNQDVETRLEAVQRASVGVSARESWPPAANTSIANPYHWAPFILIGNAL